MGNVALMKANNASEVGQLSKTTLGIDELLHGYAVTPDLLDI